MEDRRVHAIWLWYLAGALWAMIFAWQIVYRIPHAKFASSEIPVKRVAVVTPKKSLHEFVEEEAVEEIELVEELAPMCPFTELELTQFSQLVQAEAGNQGEDGMRYVIDVVLNRIEDCNFPSTLKGVIYQKNQFSTAGYLGIYRRNECIIDLIKEEYFNRSDPDVRYFRTGRYSRYGEPLFVCGDHYFSG